MSTDEGKACYYGYPNESHNILMGFPGLPVVKNSPAKQEMQETQVQSLGQEDPLEWEMEPALVSREPGRLQSIGSQGGKYDSVQLSESK